MTDILEDLDSLEKSVRDFQKKLSKTDRLTCEERALLGNPESQIKMSEMTNNVDEKIKWLQMAADQEYDDVYNSLAFYYSQKLLFDKTIEYYEKAIKANKTNRYTKVNLALSYMQSSSLRDLKKAEELLDEVKAEDTNLNVINCFYGVLSYFKKDYDKAKELFENYTIKCPVKIYYVAIMKFNGLGYEKDIKEALKIMFDNMEYAITKKFIKEIERLDIAIY